MGYTIRDVDKALVDKINAENFTVSMEGKQVRLRTVIGSPDEILSGFNLPCICVESGWMIRTPEVWQSDPVVNSELDGIYAEKYSCRMIDVFYTYKIGFYVSFKPHCTYMEVEFLKLFPNKFSATVVDFSGNEYIVGFISDPDLVNLDEIKGSAKKDRTLAETQMDSDVRIHRRDKLVTAQLTMENNSVESILRPYSGVQFEVGFRNIAPVAVIATITQATITFVEE